MKIDILDLVLSAMLSQIGANNKLLSKAIYFLFLKKKETRKKTKFNYKIDNIEER